MEFSRLTGNLLLLAKPSDSEQSEAHYRHALEIAREQQARSLDLRASTSLARLWADRRDRHETGYSNPELDAKIEEALSIADAEKRKTVMADIEQILQDSGIIIQPYWRKLYNHSTAAVTNHGMHPTYEHDFGKVWLDA